MVHFTPKITGGGDNGFGRLGSSRLWGSETKTSMIMWQLGSLGQMGSGGLMMLSTASFSLNPSFVSLKDCSFESVPPKGRFWDASTINRSYGNVHFGGESIKISKFVLAPERKLLIFSDFFFFFFVNWDTYWWNIREWAKKNNTCLAHFGPHLPFLPEKVQYFILG